MVLKACLTLIRLQFVVTGASVGRKGSMAGKSPFANGFHDAKYPQSVEIEVMVRRLYTKLKVTLGHC